jgi:hypothetical protein
MITRGTRALLSLILVASSACALLAASACHTPKQSGAAAAPAVAPVDPLKQAIAKVEEDRGEPAGRDVEVDVPRELKHYTDRRRFLAVQTAEQTQARLALPHDYSELATLARNGQLVELPALGDHYVLYGAGEAATDQPFTHYDVASGMDVALCVSEAEYRQERERLNEAITKRGAVIIDLQRALRGLGKRERARRRALNRQLVVERRGVALLVTQQKVTDKFYRDPALHRMLASERQTIEDLARDFGSQSYDLNDPDSRRQLKTRLLSFIRPEARDALLQIAREYGEKFNRPIPITSLVRTEQYQKHLAEWNRNAARNSAPPHVTGLAFDVYYKFMSAAEQDFLMATVARLKDAGRVEALRETRDHIHVFAFSRGQRPSEDLVAKAIGESKVARYSTRAATKRRAKRMT